MSAPITYNLMSKNNKYFWRVCALLCVLFLIGLYSAYRMEHYGHWITGMSNQVVWGLPHVFAIFLILTASGVLNVASVASVFGKHQYQTWGRLSGLLAVSILIGGLLVLVLDLGRPDRLIIAMTHYNFKSIFAWNVFLYSGFALLVIIYLWMMIEPKMNRFYKKAGTMAFIWRIILTTGTGSIFGILVARSAYDTLMMVPLFIAMSLSFGTALFILYLALLYRTNQNNEVITFLNRLCKLQIKFIAVVLAFTFLLHGMKVVDKGFSGYVAFVLTGGGIYTAMFWIGQIVMGSLIPMVLMRSKLAVSLKRRVFACCLIIFGAFSQLYVIIIGGQVYPLELFPGKQVSSSFFDGVIANYQPSLPELGLGLGGIGLALLVSLLIMRVLPFLPSEQSLRALSKNPAP